MMDRLASYDFDLPKELIATAPPKSRGESRLLCLLRHEPQTRHDQFKNIGSYLRPGDVLVINDTKVMKARLYAYKPTGGRMEILLSRPRADGAWEALIKGCGKNPLGKTFCLGSQSGPKGLILAKMPDEDHGFIIKADVDFFDYAENHGEIPLPPYMGRSPSESDSIRYQTVYAKELGAIAAPTAGLHFTKEHLESLSAQGVVIASITLHVGAGTFLPMRHDYIADHIMHKEWFKLDEACAHTLNEAKKSGGRIIAVGSTAMRSLEQAMAWMHEEGQNDFKACSGETQFFIKPGHKFLACDALITNFHTPRSTLLVLVCAVAGYERIIAAYKEAVAERYRFFSYGDACFMEVAL